MIELTKKELHKIVPLCIGRSEDTVLWSCVEGNMGRVWVDDEYYPKSAIALVADFCYLLGDLNEIVDAGQVMPILENCKHKIIITNNPSWISFIEKKYQDSFRKLSRYAIKVEPNIFNKEQLSNYIRAAEPYQVVRIDESIYYKALTDNFMADLCCFFSTSQNFLGNGVGYVVLHEGEIVAGASSYSYCKDSIEITIGTKREFRRKGLALACASKLILECLNRNIYPRWEAVNLESVALAEKLGYHFDREFTVYSI